jgi:peptidoglycan hydrolase-like protein with peptidoglycan-binding domain
MRILKYGDTGEDVKFVQRALNQLLNTRLKADGNFGKLTEESVRIFQKQKGFPLTGVIGQFESTVLDPIVQTKYLTNSDIEIAANRANLPVSIVKALREVEARADGFLYDGRAVILFERHKFYQALVRIKGQAYADGIALSYPDICNNNRGGYLGYEGEYTRVAQAFTIEPISAIKSTSYGLFQIRGVLHQQCGYADAYSFSDAMQLSEKNHLDAFIKLVLSDQRLSAAIRQRNYKRIAELYNGPSSEINLYAEKLRLADTKFV